MKDKKELLRQVKATVKATDPTATLILFGSYARDDYNEGSDLDLLILIDKEYINAADKKRLTYPLYDIEFETGTLISPMVFSKKEWESRKGKTPFHENVSREGKVL
ncbi:nucleotidyltransferase domain-containing protein [Arundinibacter roseus]|uniref:Nucleotidyltransferase domain-containing protein n=1 Tax=Arundinibacter roseus TaxID=2070510 RepID=A0A4R4K7M4_9BACT|nr:nucleotidyltransferase domain-containing protein [Arundinibacter roseus]TDB63604.1 nucleotidyltransferase domain-containing protein [Arundinibacter roseus]